MKSKTAQRILDNTTQDFKDKIRREVKLYDMKTNKLIQLPEGAKRSIELKTVGHLAKIVSNASEIKQSDRMPYIVRAFEKLLNEEKSMLTHDILELENEKQALIASMNDMGGQLNEAKLNIDRLKRQIK